MAFTGSTSNEGTFPNGVTSASTRGDVNDPTQNEATIDPAINAATAQLRFADRRQ
jgi:hypothetical protein